MVVVCLKKKKKEKKEKKKKRKEKKRKEKKEMQYRPTRDCPFKVMASLIAKRAISVLAGAERATALTAAQKRGICTV